MLSKIYNAVAVLAIAHLLALGGLVGYLVSAGRLSPERVEQIAELLRSEPGAEAAADSENADGGDGAASADDAVAQADEADVGAIATTGAAPAPAEQFEAQRRAAQLRSLALQRAERDLVAQRELLEQLLRDQIERQEQFDRAVANWKQQKARLRDEARDAGFERELEYFSKLPPKQAKEILVRKWQASPADAVRLLNAVKTSVGQSILETMKSPEELQVMFELLEQLGKQDIDRFVPGSGMSSADASG